MVSYPIIHKKEGMKEALHMLQISSHPNNLSIVEDLVKSVVKNNKLNDDLHGNILISLTEAVTNAMVHGNCCDQNKNVLINYSQQPNQLMFRISDEGRGFDPEALPDPTTPENINTIGGRGVFLMRQLTHRLRFKDSGRTVEMLFRI